MVTTLNHLDTKSKSVIVNFPSIYGNLRMKISLTQFRGKLQIGGNPLTLTQRFANYALEKNIISSTSRNFAHSTTIMSWEPIVATRENFSTHLNPILICSTGLFSVFLLNPVVLLQLLCNCRGLWSTQGPHETLCTNTQLQQPVFCSIYMRPCKHPH